MNETDTSAPHVETVIHEVESWPEVTSGPHQFGGHGFWLEGEELGHVHRDRQTADIPFPRAVRDELIASGQAAEHRARPDSGWVTHTLRTDEDATEVVNLFRRKLASLSGERA